MYESSLSKSSTIAGECQTQDKREEIVNISPKVQDLDLDELWQANRLLNSSEALHSLQRINEFLKNGYKFNTLEQKIFEKFVDNYNVNYKSPLATAMNERDDA